MVVQNVAHSVPITTTDAYKKRSAFRARSIRLLLHKREVVDAVHGKHFQCARDKALEVFAELWVSRDDVVHVAV